MAVETAKKFLERLNNQPDWRDQLAMIPPQDAEHLLSFAHGKGFVYSHDDLEVALADAPDSPVSELAEAVALGE